MSKITVVASYPGGINRTYDMALFEIAKHIVGGSGIGGGGCDLRSGTRTNDWSLATQEDADLLKTLLLQAKVPGLEVKVL